MNKAYEFTVIYDNRMITNDEKTNPRSEVEQLIQKAGGSIDETEEWGDKPLSYAIKKQDSGFFISYKLTLPEHEANDLQEKVKHVKGVLRWLLVLPEDEV